MMTPEEELLIKQQAQLNMANANAMARDIDSKNQAMIIEEKEKGMVKEQLDLSEELMTMKHLLHGHVLEEDANGLTKWNPKPDIPELDIFSEYGVYLIMDAIISHVSKNSLLSNLDEQTILTMMLDFSEDLNDTIFMQSEKIFKYPSFEVCKDELKKRIKKKTDLRKFALEILGKGCDVKEIEKEVLGELEGKIEKEMEKVRESIMKDKYKRYLMLMRIVRHFVHFSLNRAYQGQERRSIRQHSHITEINNPSLNNQNDKNSKGWLGLKK